jgi:hypothetical protein
MSTWEWFFAIIGSVAFLMAIQPFIQYLFGRPKLIIVFEVIDISEGQILNCLLQNEPIHNILLQKLGVYRTAIDDLVVQFSILDCKTQRKISNAVIPKIKTKPYVAETQRIQLPSSKYPASFTMCAFSKKMNGTCVMDDKSETTVLLVGFYIASIKTDFGHNSKQISQQFSVSYEYPQIRLVGKYKYE